MNRIAVLCGTGMSAFSTSLSSSVDATSELIVVESEWGEVPIKVLQELVNEKFLKEKDIRFLITRDLFWEPIKFSAINIDQNTLFYPGTTDRSLS